MAESARGSLYTSSGSSLLIDDRTIKRDDPAGRKYVQKKRAAPASSPEIGAISRRSRGWAIDRPSVKTSIGLGPKMGKEMMPAPPLPLGPKGGQVDGTDHDLLAGT